MADERELKALREVAKAANALLKRCDDEGLILGAGRNYPTEKEGPMTTRLRKALEEVPNAPSQGPERTTFANELRSKVFEFAKDRDEGRTVTAAMMQAIEPLINEIAKLRSDIDFNRVSGDER